MVNVRTKGKGGEYEARDLVLSWLAPVYVKCGAPPPELKRNVEQSRSGGADLVGVDWLALEVKRHETLAVAQWWRQAERQAGPGQLPVLMYRQSRKPWSFRVRARLLHGRTEAPPWGYAETVADLDQEHARLWLQAEAFWRLQ